MSRVLSQVLSLDDFERLARRKLPAPLYAYVSGAVEEGYSLRGNRDAFARWAFQPRVLENVSRRDTTLTLLGQQYALPAGIAPMGLSALTAYRGDIIQARAAARAGAPFIMSGSSLIRLEEVMQAAPQSWFQAYLPGDPDQIRALIERVAAAGVSTLVITVDTPVAANRENNVRAGFSTPLRPSARLAWQGLSHPAWSLGTFLRTLLRHGMPHFENNHATRGAPILSSKVLRDFSDRGHLNWQHVDSIRRMWKGPMVLKGILHADDAVRARQQGINGIIVSNHGGRQLDGSRAPLDALPRIVDAVGADLEIMLDSGIRRGTDVLKALALGAKAVFVGRPFNYAGVVAGEAGIAHGIRLIGDEVSRDMAMLGVTSLKDVGPQLLSRIE